VIAIERFLRAVQRRLRLGWLIATTQTAVPFIAAGALALVLIGWVVPWAWPEPSAAVLVIVSTIAIVGAMFFVPVTVEMAARAADRGLGVKDAFSASLQFRDHERFGSEIQARAERFATTHSASDAVPWTRRPRRWIAAALLAAIAIALALLANPQDDRRAEAAATADVLKTEAEELADTAQSIRDLDDPTQAELAIAAELERLADELQQLDDLTEAESLLRDASQTLAPDSSQMFSTKAAVQGLNRSLEAQPLPGASGDAADQLDQVAANLDDLSADEAEALAERLEALAATQDAGNAAAAGALADAATALRDGDSAGAQAALGEASEAQQAGEGQVREGQVGEAGSAAAAEAADRVAQSGDGIGDGDGDSDDSGSGEGSGSGSGEESNSGSGSGQGGGSASGDVTGASGGSNAVGQGGQGQAQGGGESTEVGTETDAPTLFNPGGDSEEIFPTGTSNGETETTGLGQGPTIAGGSQVPLSDAIGEFERQAVAALGDPSVPPSQRALVQRYFDRLAGLDS